MTRAPHGTGFAIAFAFFAGLLLGLSAVLLS